jgi:hypothetical protein
VNRTFQNKQRCMSNSDTFEIRGREVIDSREKLERRMPSTVRFPTPRIHG